MLDISYIFVQFTCCTLVHHLKWSCIKTGPGIYFGPDLPLNWSRLASIMVRKADSKMVLSAKCNYVQNYINPASNGIKFVFSKTVHMQFS